MRAGPEDSMLLVLTYVPSRDLDFLLQMFAPTLTLTLTSSLNVLSSTVIERLYELCRGNYPWSN